jgi:hypothetical protein
MRFDIEDKEYKTFSLTAKKDGSDIDQCKKMAADLVEYFNDNDAPAFIAEESEPGERYYISAMIGDGSLVTQDEIRDIYKWIKGGRK